MEDTAGNREQGPNQKVTVTKSSKHNRPLSSQPLPALKGYIDKCPASRQQGQGDKQVRSYSPHYLTPSRWRVADQETGAPAADGNALIRRQNTTRAGRRRHKEQGDRDPRKTTLAVGYESESTWTGRCILYDKGSNGAGRGYDCNTMSLQAPKIES